MTARYLGFMGSQGTRDSTGGVPRVSILKYPSSEMARPFIQRGDRKPLYVQVLTQPALHACWSVNVSASGIGLVASPATAQDGPREGDSLDLEFTLPDSHARI